MSVIEISNDQEFSVQLRDAGARLVVVDFFAVWCGPCNQIAPFVKQLSTKYPGAVFLKVDVEKCEEVARTYRVTAMPTFVFIKNAQELERIRGADKVQLEDKVKRYSNEEAATNVSGGTITSSIVAAVGPPGYSDLTHLIFKAQCECLNQSDDHTWENVLNTSTSSYLESDCDEQLILFITFNQVVKLHSLMIQGPAG